jgi:hypothetical protein
VIAALLKCFVYSVAGKTQNFRSPLLTTEHYWVCKSVSLKQLYLERTDSLLLSSFLIILSSFPFYFFSFRIIGVITSRRMRWAEDVARMRGIINAYRTVVGKSEGKNQRCRWKGNVRMDRREVGWEGLWIHLAQDTYQKRAVINTVRNFQVP